MFRGKVKKSRRKSKIGTILYNHINNNKRGYLVVTILFFVGLIVGVFLINSAGDAQLEEIRLYFNELVTNIKTYNNIDYASLLKQSLISNCIIILLLWFGASTIVGIPVVYGTIAIKGFFVGYTISGIISSFGTGRGILIALSIMLLHNIILIPTMIGTSVSGVKMYQSIIKNKERNNIKIEILRHTIFCAFMLMFMMISSLIEVYVSTNLFIFLLKRI